MRGEFVWPNYPCSAIARNVTLTGNALVLHGCMAVSLPGPGLFRANVVLV